MVEPLGLDDAPVETLDGSLGRFEGGGDTRLDCVVVRGVATGTWAVERRGVVGCCSELSSTSPRRAICNAMLRGGVEEATGVIGVAATLGALGVSGGERTAFRIGGCGKARRGRRSSSDSDVVSPFGVSRSEGERPLLVSASVRPGVDGDERGIATGTGGLNRGGGERGGLEEFDGSGRFAAIGAVGWATRVGW